MLNPEERIYIIVPETVQTTPTPADSMCDTSRATTINMEPGRLMAQCCHAGRCLQHSLELFGTDYRAITTIVLSVRNSKELAKITRDLNEWVSASNAPAAVVRFFDENPPFYQTIDDVHTATIVGPVDSSEVLDHIIGHLELYK